MDIENNLHLFKEWTVQLGCPLDVVPCDNAIKCIFKSRQLQLFKDLMKRVQPVAKVREARKNFLIETIRHCDDKSLMFSKAITHEFDEYKKIQDLKKVYENEKNLLEKERHDHKSALYALEMKNMQLPKENCKQSKLNALKNIYTLKLEEIDKQIAQEEKKSARMATVAPLKWTPCYDDETISRIVNDALNELNNFDERSDLKENIKTAKLQLWEKMRVIFDRVPNSCLFKYITSLNMELEHKFLTHIHDQNKSKSTACKEKFTTFEQTLLETKVCLTGFVAQHVNFRTQRIEYEEIFADVLKTFVHEIETKLQISSEDENMSELLSMYVFQYNYNNMKKIQNEALCAQIAALNQLIVEDGKRLANHELLLQGVKETYVNTNVCINRIQCELLRMKHMKEKLMYPKNMFHSLIKENSLHLIKTNNSNMHRKYDVTSDSFELAGENVLSSTKLDLDATLHKNDQTLSTTRTARLYTPSNTAEFLMFMEIPLNNFKFSIQPCPFTSTITFLHTLNSQFKIGGLPPSLLLSSHHALEQIASKLKWMELFQDIDTLNKPEPFSVDKVDEEVLRSKQKYWDEEIAELLDKIEAALKYVMHLLQKNNNIYDFVLKNVLKNWILPSRTYKNYTFVQYEAEFRRYYSIVENMETIT